MGERSYVEEILLEWRKKIQILIARSAFGAEDKGLLENELLEKVYNCIVDYDETYDVTFSTFTNKCLQNHIQVYLRREQRKKHAFISDAVSLDYCVEDGDTISELIADKKNPNADAIVFSIMVEDLLDLLPAVCKDIVKLLCDGLSESEIARSIGEDTIMVRCFIEECIRPLMQDLLTTEEEEDA
jgi:DNA-directed RNA polymerase specialized sigma24 family protein